MKRRKLTARKKKIIIYPHPDRRIRIIDDIVLVIGIIGPLANIPQIFKLFIEKNSIGISAITWMFYVMMGIPWIVYGIIHKEKPIIVAQSLWLITNVIILLGVLMYS